MSRHKRAPTTPRRWAVEKGIRDFIEPLISELKRGPLRGGVVVHQVRQSVTAGVIDHAPLNAVELDRANNERMVLAANALKDFHGEE